MSAIQLGCRAWKHGGTCLIFFFYVMAGALFIFADQNERDIPRIITVSNLDATTKPQQKGLLKQKVLLTSILPRSVKTKAKAIGLNNKDLKSQYPQLIEGGNSGDGSPLVLGTSNTIADLHCPCDPTTTVHVLDWDGDGKEELVCSGNDIYSYHFTDTLADGTPIVERGNRWGLMSRQPQRNENDQGLTGYILAVEDFDSDGTLEAIVGPRYYSRNPTVALSLSVGAPTNRADGRIVKVEGRPDEVRSWKRGSVAAVDWDNDNHVDLVVLSNEIDDRFYNIDPRTGVAAEDQRHRYHENGRWAGEIANSFLLLYRNISVNGQILFSYVGPVGVKLPPHTMWISVVNPDEPKAGLLLLTYYGQLYHLPLHELSDQPKWGKIVELFTLHNEPFNRATNFDMSISVADVFEPGRFDIFAGDRSQSPSWCRYYGQDEDDRPIYASPRRIKQENPHVGNSFFSVPTVGDWRGTGMPDLLVGGVEGYILWYKTLSTNPLRFAPPERVRSGTTEIRRLARANPAGGHHWGGSQGPYDGDTGGYSNPVLADWDGDGLLDLLVSDMVGLYDWYSNWGTKTQPELGPPQRLHLTDGQPLLGPWRQQPGIGYFTGGDLPDIVIQDKDLDLALFRRVGKKDLSALLPGEKLRYQDGETIKTHGVYTPGGGDGRGRTKINVVDWDGDRLLDLLIGVGPQHRSPYRGSYVLFAKNISSNRLPVFERPVVLLWDSKGQPLEFWRHGVHMAPVDWDDDGQYELLAGSDQGRIWYWKPQHFGKSASGSLRAPLRPLEEQGLGRDD